MGEIVENIQIAVIESCLRDIKDATLTLSERLTEIGVPLNCINVEHWPKYDKKGVNFQMWDGNNYIRSSRSKTSSTNLTSECILAIAKSRQILKRKF